MNALDWFLNVLVTVRTEILQRFMIPGLNMSWWSFAVILLVVGILISVLINAVRASSYSSVEMSSSRSKVKRQQKLKDKKAKEHPQRVAGSMRYMKK